MKKYIYTVGAAALALAMSGLPALALAENNGAEGQGEASAQVKVQALGTSASTSAGVSVTARGDEEQQKQQETNKGEQKQTQSNSFGEKQKFERTGSTTEASSTRPSIKGGDDEQEIDLELEDGGTLATSNDDLNKKIEVRKHQLEQEVASSSPDHQEIVANANEVRLAVHALLASKDLIGGIGQQVSEIAKHVNDSVASTTNAEAKIQSRGFLIRLLFGGDTTSAEVIAQEAVQNQARIDSLTTLLAQANISADLKATLTAQITALTDAQVRLQALAEKEKSAWGLFSWRF